MSTHESVIVRKAAESDIDALGQLWTEMMNFHHYALPYPLVPEAVTFAQKYMKSLLDQDAALILVAEVNGQVTGYCRARVDRYSRIYEQHLYGEIAELSVRETMRRRGVGKALYVATCEWFGSQGVARIEVGTATQNPVSNAFWEKMGFVTYRETKVRELDDSGST